METFDDSNFYLDLVGFRMTLIDSLFFGGIPVSSEGLRSKEKFTRLLRSSKYFSQIQEK